MVSILTLRSNKRKISTFSIGGEFYVPNKASSIFMYSGAKKPFEDLGSALSELVSQSFFNKGLSQENKSENDLAGPAYGPLRDGYR